MAVIMLDDLEPYMAHLPSVTTHIRRKDDGLSLCGNRWGGFAVAEPGARLPDLLPFETPCETCMTVQEAGG